MNKSDYYNPLGKKNYLSHQHFERYRFACSILQPGKIVLDIGCGTGYGTIMLFQHGCKVIGADLDEKIINVARNKWNYDAFVKANVLELPFPSASFDAVVSFETIEHVRKGELFNAEILRVLRPGGIFICSTPNVLYTSHPKYHLKEYRADELIRITKTNGYIFLQEGISKKRAQLSFNVFPRPVKNWISVFEKSNRVQIVKIKYSRWWILRDIIIEPIQKFRFFRLNHKCTKIIDLIFFKIGRYIDKYLLRLIPRRFANSVSLLFKKK